VGKKLFLFPVLLIFLSLFVFGGEEEWNLVKCQELYGADFGIVFGEGCVRVSCPEPELVGDWEFENGKGWCESELLVESNLKRFFELTEGRECKSVLQTVYRSVPNDLCLNVPDPVVLSDWEVVGCMQGSNVFKRSLKGGILLTNPSNPSRLMLVERNFDQFKFEGECNVFLPLISGIAFDLSVPLLIVVLVVVGLIVFGVLFLLSKRG